MRNKKSNQESRSLDPYRPQGNLLSLREAMNRLFDESIWDPFDQFDSFRPSAHRVAGFPRVDISEDDQLITVKADVPGIDPDLIDIEVDGDALFISGRSESQAEEKGKEFYRVERESGQFQRVIYLPARVEADKATAEIKNGVLTISLFKAEGPKKKKIQIKK